MKWSRALSYGVKYLALTAVFNVVGILLLLSGTSITLNFYDSSLVVKVSFLRNFLASFGSLTLIALGIAILILGNIAALVKILSEVLKELDIVW